MLTDKQKGVSLIITFFIMIILLAVVLFISTLLYSEVKIMKNIGDSMVSLYAADSGVEKVLYYDRQVIPILSSGAFCDANTPCTSGKVCSISGVCTTSAVRGLCSMFPYNASSNPGACPESGDISGLDSSIYCVPAAGFVTPQPYNDTANPLYVQAAYNPNGCDPSVCDDCQISFSTTANGRTYNTTARVYPSSSDGKSSNFEIISKGSFNGAQRQVKILVGALQSEEAIVIKNACATPKSTAQGITVDISADVSATIAADTIGSVVATVHAIDSLGNSVPVSGGTIFLALFNGTQTSGTWVGGWETTSGTTARAYYVDIEAKDNMCVSGSSPCVPLNDKKMLNISPYPLCITQ